MAFHLRSNPTFSTPTQPRHSTTTRPRSNLTIRCGPRDNRGPLHKGRTLSIEAIQAVQALKRAHRTDPTKLDGDDISRTLSRLIKSDLIAAFKELLRQDQLQLAVKVFSTIQSEEWYKPDLVQYSDLVSALGRKGLADEIDRMIFELERELEGEISYQGKGLTTLIKALIAAGRGEATVKIYRMMKKGGWECNSVAEEYVGRILSRGLKRLGEETVASEVDRELGRTSMITSFGFKARVRGPRRGNSMYPLILGVGNRSGAGLQAFSLIGAIYRIMKTKA